MSTAREEILARIRAATGVPAAPAEVDAAYAALPRGYLRAHHDADIVALFAERAADYRAVVERVGIGELPGAVAGVLSGVSRFLVPSGLPASWLAALPDEERVVRDDPPLSALELDKVAGVVTGCAAAIAETGTIILTAGPAEGRRAISLVPDLHVCVVSERQIVELVPQAFTALAEQGLARRPITLISGPSATSDIELSRVEGVHGPRNLFVLVLREVS